MKNRFTPSYPSFAKSWVYGGIYYTDMLSCYIQVNVKIKYQWLFCEIYSSKEVLHHLDFFIFLRDILTNKF